MPISIIETPNVPFMQILDENGEVDSDLEPNLKKDQLLELYRIMTVAREMDQRMLKLQRQGRIGTFPLCTGQEAASLGPAYAMQDGDWLATAFRELPARMVRGEPLTRYLLNFNGYEEGNVIPGEVDRRVLPISVIVGAQSLHAVGLAYAEKYRKTGNVVVTFAGDGATSEGDWHEALNFAAVWQVPVVFVVQNNRWAISIPTKNQTRSETIAQKAIAYGVPGIRVDGNDILATYRAGKEAVDRARSGGGPTLIEAMTYRLMMHTTADDPTKYRSKEEEQEAWTKEPLLRLRTYLEGRGFWNRADQDALAEAVAKEVEEAVQAFEAMDGFKPDAAFDHVFGTKHPVIEEQRAHFLEELKTAAAKEKHSA